MSYLTDTEDTIRRLYAGGASDSLIADYEAIVNGEAGLTLAELYAKQKRDRLDNHRKNKHKVPILISTTPAHDVVVRVAGGHDRHQAPFLRSDLRRAGVQCDHFFEEGGDEDELEIFTVADYPVREWPYRLTQILAGVGYGAVSREEIQW